MPCQRFRPVVARLFTANAASPQETLFEAITGQTRYASFRRTRRAGFESGSLPPPNQG